jgi:hypothetical protein
MHETVFADLQPHQREVAHLTALDPAGRIVGERLLAGAALAWVIFPTMALASPASPLYPTGTTGYDVSWPNCSASAPRNPTFGIVGVSDGTGYSQNPCLAQEAAWFPSVNLYVNTGWNDQSIYLVSWQQSW